MYLAPIGVCFRTNESQGNEMNCEAASPLPQSSQKIGGVDGSKNPMIQENISRVVRWYKGRCTFEFRKIHKDFCWQSRNCDHIIRTAIACDNIQNYIESNPENWQKDKFF